MGAFPGLEFVHDFIVNEKPLQVNNTDVLFTLLPNLALPQFHSNEKTRALFQAPRNSSFV